MKNIEMSMNKSFKCIGKDCPNSCCHSWRITVDKGTYKKYKNLNNPNIRNTILACISKSDGQYIMNLNEDKVCALQEDDGLCYIHKNIGAKYLSSTCAAYPRVSKLVGEYNETHLTSSCPVVAKMLVDATEPLSFCITGDGVIDKAVKKNIEENLSQEVYFELKNIAIDCLQCRDINIWKRVVFLGLFLKEFDKARKSGAAQKELLDIIEQHRYIFEEGSVFEEMVSGQDSNVKYEMLCAIKGQFEKFFGNIDKQDRDFVEYVQKFFADNTISGEEVKSFYTNKLNSFVESNEHVFENYMVHQLFASSFPIEFETTYESFRRVVLNTLLIELMLVSILKEKGSLDLEDVVDVIYLSSRKFNHSIAISKTINGFCNQVGIDAILLGMLIKK